VAVHRAAAVVAAAMQPVAPVVVDMLAVAAAVDMPAAVAANTGNLCC
jgi:hypothetical protein